MNTPEAIEKLHAELDKKLVEVHKLPDPRERALQSFQLIHNYNQLIVKLITNGL